MLRRQSQSYVATNTQSVCQSVLVSSLIWGPGPEFWYCQTVAGLLVWGVTSDERTSLSLTTAAGPRHRSHIYRSQNQ
jgi:hypothetical protein